MYHTVKTSYESSAQWNIMKPGDLVRIIPDERIQIHDAWPMLQHPPLVKDINGMQVTATIKPSHIGLILQVTHTIFGSGTHVKISAPGGIGWMDASHLQVIQ